MINDIPGKGEGRGFLLLFAQSFMMKILGKGVTREGKGYNNMDHVNQYNYKPMFNGVFSRNNLPEIKDGA